MSCRGGLTRTAVVAGLALVGLAAGEAWAQAPPPRPTKPQAAAAVVEYRQAREGCATPGPECDAAAKQRFVATMNCVVRGQKSVTAATLDQDFTGYVDLVSEVIEGQDPAAQTPLGPCFASSPAPPGGPGAPAAAQPAAGAGPSEAEGPSLEALRRFRKQAEEQSKPGAGTTGGAADAADHDKLKADLEAMRQRLQSGAAPGGGGALGGAIGGAPTLTPSAAVPALLAPALLAPAPLAPPLAPAPSGTTTIQGGPSVPGTTNIQGGPTLPPAATSVIPYPGGGPLVPPSSGLAPGSRNLQLPPLTCGRDEYVCRRRPTDRGACVPRGFICY